jgi:hypothetical protein
MEPHDEPIPDQPQNDEDAAIFGMEGAAGTGEVSVEVTRTNRKKFMIFVLMVGVLSVMLVMCIAVSLVVYLVYRKDPEQDKIAQAEPPPPPPKEMKARIKEVDVGQKTLRMLVGVGKYQTFQITAQTEFFDAAGKRLPTGLAALEEMKDADVTILQTEDRRGLQWLKLTSAK